MIDRAQEYGLVGTVRYFNYYWGDADSEQGRLRERHDRKEEA